MIARLRADWHMWRGHDVLHTWLYGDGDQYYCMNCMIDWPR